MTPPTQLPGVLGLGIGLASGGASAFTSFAEAQDRNRAIDAQVRSTRRALVIENRQLAQQFASDREQVQRRAAQYRGALAAAAASRGTGAASIDALAFNAQLLAAQDDATLRSNTLRQQTALRLAAVQRLEVLGSQRRPVALDTLQGLIGGFGSGANLGINLGTLLRDAQPAGRPAVEWPEPGSPS